MNAVLQSLNNIQEFSCYFSQLPSLEMKTNGRQKVYHSRSYTRQEMHDVVMAEELRKVSVQLFRQIYTLHCNVDSNILFILHYVYRYSVYILGCLIARSDLNQITFGYRTLDRYSLLHQQKIRE